MIEYSAHLAEVAVADVIVGLPGDEMVEVGKGILHQLGGAEKKAPGRQQDHDQRPPVPQPALSSLSRRRRGGKAEEKEQRVFYRAQHSGEEGGQKQRREGALSSGTETAAAQQKDPGQEKEGDGVPGSIPGLLDVKKGKGEQQRQDPPGDRAGVKVPAEEAQKQKGPQGEIDHRCDPSHHLAVRGLFPRQRGQHMKGDLEHDGAFRIALDLLKSGAPPQQPVRQTVRSEMEHVLIRVQFPVVGEGHPPGQENKKDHHHGDDPAGPGPGICLSHGIPPRLSASYPKIQEKCTIFCPGNQPPGLWPERKKRLRLIHISDNIIK